jgi:hypothetical protein
LMFFCISCLFSRKRAFFPLSCIFMYHSPILVYFNSTYAPFSSSSIVIQAYSSSNDREHTL